MDQQCDSAPAAPGHPTCRLCKFRERAIQVVAQQLRAVLGLVVSGIEVENIATTRKTLPDFPGLWSSLLV